MQDLTKTTNASPVSQASAGQNGQPPGAPSDIALEVHDLTVAYHKKPVLWGIDLAVPCGRLVGIVGPNGAGKSTLIKAAMVQSNCRARRCKASLRQPLEVLPNSL